MTIQSPTNVVTCAATLSGTGGPGAGAGAGADSADSTFFQKSLFLRQCEHRNVSVQPEHFDAASGAVFGSDSSNDTGTKPSVSQISGIFG
jgi:hypothetical protein